MGTVQPPSGGLIGYSNYNLYDNCNNLTGVSVTVNITDGMVAIPSAPSVAGIQSNGIGFQLNCLPRAGGKIYWQQYIMVVSRTGEDLRWGVNNWDVNPADTDGIIDQGGDLATLPSPFGAGYASIPAGYRLEIALINDANNDNITGATFSMYDQGGAPVFQPKTVALTTLTDVNGHEITAAELSPIVDIDFVVGGYANGADTTLSQGAGTITFRANNSLTVLNTFPPCTAGVNTAESSNVTYGELGSSPSGEITQTFQVYHPWFLIGAQVKMQSGATVTALWRSNDTHLDLFATGTDGTVWSTWWEDAPGWQQWFPIWNTQVKMQPGATVTALWRSNDTHLDLFATGTDGTVWSTWWEDAPGWQQWFPIWNQFGNNFKMKPGVLVSALWRSNDTHLDLFATGTDGAVWSIWWEAGPGW